MNSAPSHPAVSPRQWTMLWGPLGLFLALVGLLLLGLLSYHFVFPFAWLRLLTPRHLLVIGIPLGLGLILSGMAVVRGRSLCGKVGIALSMVGTLGLATLGAFYLADSMGLLIDPEVDLKQRTQASQQAMHTAKTRMNNLIKTTGNLPSSRAASQLLDDLRDGWNQRLFVSIEDGYYSISSAGPDQEVGTPDDIPLE